MTMLSPSSPSETCNRDLDDAPVCVAGPAGRPMLVWESPPLPSLQAATGPRVRKVILDHPTMPRAADPVGPNLIAIVGGLAYVLALPLIFMAAMLGGFLKAGRRRGRRRGIW